MYLFLTRIALLVIVACSIATASSAQDNESGYGPDNPNNETSNFLFPVGSPEALPRKTARELSAAVTNAVVTELKAASAFCGRIKQREYVIDCLAYEHARIAAALPNTGEYAAVKEAVAQTAARLERVVRQNPSRTLPTAPIAQGGSQPRRTARALRPVATEALPKAAAEATRIIQETQTVLIRSTENSQERRRQFQRIVSAMGTGTILLRWT